MSIMQVVVLALEAILGVFFAYGAVSLFTSKPVSMAKTREALRYPHWYWALAGILSTIGAVGLFAGLAFPVVGAVAALWGVAYFVVAVFTHLVRGDVHGLTSPLSPLPFLALCVGLAALRWADLSPALTHLFTVLPVL